VNSESLSSRTIGSYLSALHSSAPTPGGGSAACLTGALAAALAGMVLSVAQAKSETPERAVLQRRFIEMEAEFLQLAEDDETAFSRVMEAYRLPKTTPDRAVRREEALASAAEVPLRAARLGTRLLEALPEVLRHAAPSIVSDVGAAAHLGQAAVESSLLNVRINIVALRESATKRNLSEDVSHLSAAAGETYTAICRAVAARISEG
jgi:formiminotetrahydrofolate cyclodeaminase